MLKSAKHPETNMASIVSLLEFEEGWREKPYVDTEGYPTVGYGFLLGPKIPGTKQTRNAECRRLYTFTLPKAAGEVWLQELIASTLARMRTVPHIEKAILACLPPGPQAGLLHNPRVAVLVSMAHQMGVDGLADFHNTLRHIGNQDWFQAETGMLKSKWATQTPNRARRHALQMRHGTWLPEYQ